MGENNICKFNQFGSVNEDVSVLNFVYETGAEAEPFFVVQSVFRVHVVISGQGVFETLNQRENLKEGDIFFTFPSTEYIIKNVNNLTYAYISFIGTRSYNLLSCIGVDKKNFIQRDKNDLVSFWQNALSITSDENMNLITKGVLLFTFGRLCPKREQAHTQDEKKIVLTLKKLAEDRFSDPKVNLKTLCEELFFSPKYASAIFKKNVGVGFSDFLISLRINNATRLMENRMTSVKQIAFLSGFDDVFYFSRLYRKKEGVSPRERIQNIQNEKKKD